MTEHSHPIDLDINRTLPLLTREIYATPFAFLRENVQNAFDAIRIQMYRDVEHGAQRGHQIEISFEDNKVTIRDTGIGMSREDLQNLYWSIGKSGKHTAEARSAGVVGTFGIGGMANFGVCSRLEIASRTYEKPRSVKCWAERERLSAKESCVFYADGPEDQPPGTTVMGTLIDPITPATALKYLRPIVQYLNVPVHLADEVLSLRPFPEVTRDDGVSVTVTEGDASLGLFVRALHNGQAQVQLESFSWEDKPVQVRGVLAVGGGTIAAYQHGFMLANVPLASIFSLGGSIDCPLLKPTAGREAVTDESRGIVQTMVQLVERALAEHIAKTPGLPERFSAFFQYLIKSSRFDLGAAATIRLFGEDRRVTLQSIRDRSSAEVYFARDGYDLSLMQAYREQGKIVLLLSSDSQRQKVERHFLIRFCNGKPLEDRVTCLKLVEDLDFSELSVKYRFQDKLRRQYLIDTLVVKAGHLSHAAMLWVPPPSTGVSMTLFVDFRHPHIRRLVQIKDPLSSDSILDIFIRDYIFPHLENAYPDLKKRDFDALLKKIQSSVESYEIDPDDIRRIEQLAAVTNMSPEIVAAILGGRRQRNVGTHTAVRRSDVAKVTDVVRESQGKSIEEMQQEFYVALLESESEAKILDATESAESLALARYYMALTRDAHVLYRRIFLERNPSTDFVWGGHRAGYLFYSEGNCVVYYDISFGKLIETEDLTERTGSHRLEHRPLVLKNMVYLPVLTTFENYFIPSDETLRFTVNHQIMGVTGPSML